MSLTTNLFKTRVGEVVIEIDDPFANATADVCDIGKLKYEFIVDTGQEEETSITSGYGSLSFTIFDDNGAVFDRYTSWTAEYKATLTLTPYGATALIFPFVVARKDISIDESQRKTTFNLRPAKINETATIDDLSFDDVIVSDFYLTDVDVVQAGGLIDQVLTTFNSSGANIIRSAPANAPVAGYVFNVAEAKVNNELYFLVWNHPVLGSSALQIDLFKFMSALEGSYFGSAFNTNFWIYRLDATSPVTVSADDVDNETLRIKINSTATAGRLAGSVGTTTWAAGGSNLINADLIRSFGDVQPTRSINLSFNIGECLIKGQWATGSGKYINPNIVNLNRTETELLRVGVEAYERFFTREKPFTIQFTCNNFSLIKPYECFQFNTSVPARYQSKIFRGNVFEYDFLTGKCYIEAYQVN
jgi:hypothetical protein